MILYHFLDRKVYDILLKRGYLNCEKEHLWFLEDLDEDEKPEDIHHYQAYLYIIDRMKRLLPPKPALAGEFPMWAWYKHGPNCFLNGPHFNDLNYIKTLDELKEETSSDMMWHSLHDKNNPHIRSYVDHLNNVRLTIDIPEECVLLTDFTNWHYCLNNSHFNDPEITGWDYGNGQHFNNEEFDRYWKWKQRLSMCEVWDSWDSPEHLIPGEKYHTARYGLYSIQAVFWLLTLGMVKEVQFCNDHPVSWDYEKGELVCLK